MAETSFSIVIETENLGMGSIDGLKLTLDSLANQTISPLQANEVIIVVSGRFPAEHKDQILSVYPWLHFVYSDKLLEYTEAKNFGASFATADIVVFADADVVYEASWLGSILEGFSKHQDISVVSGETRVGLNSSYEFAMNIAWMLPIEKRDSGFVKCKSFRLNNFAIKKKILNDAPIPKSDGVFRKHIPSWWELLDTKGCLMLRAPNAKGVHEAPQSITDWFYRFTIMGADNISCARTRRVNSSNRWFKNKFLYFPLQMFNYPYTKLKMSYKRTRVLLAESRGNIKFIFMGYPIALVSLLLIFLGGFIEVLKPGFLHKNIEKYTSPLVD